MSTSAGPLPRRSEYRSAPSAETSSEFARASTVRSPLGLLFPAGLSSAGVARAVALHHHSDPSTVVEMRAAGDADCPRHGEVTRVGEQRPLRAELERLGRDVRTRIWMPEASSGRVS